MKILVATNYFKGSLSAVQAAEIIEQGIKEVDSSIEVIKNPIADGGDGTLEAICACTECREIISPVNGPLDQTVEAKWLIIEHDKKTAVIEGAQANGLSLLKPEEYNPLKTTTYGIGELIKLALDNNCKNIYVTIGGSSTNDGGVGMLQALGVSFKDKNGKEINRGGGELNNIETIDLSNIDNRLKQIQINVACDVENPLCGSNGASVVYGQQKGATPEMVKLLDSNLSHFAEVTEKTIGTDIRNYPGTGAAGGIGFALKAFLSAELINGFRFVCYLSGLNEKIKGADLVITTEGRLDNQSLSGKAPYQMAQISKNNNIPTIVIAGAVERHLNLEHTGIVSVFSIADGPVTLDDSMKNADYLLKNITIQILNILKLNFKSV